MRTFINVLITSVFIISSTQSFAQPVLLDSPYLLTPTGQYGVGYKDIHVLNTNLCPDAFYLDSLKLDDYSEENTKHCHEIMLRVYYPTKDKPVLSNFYDQPVLDDFISDLKNNVELTGEQKRSLKKLYKIKTYNAKDAAPVSDKRFPIIFFVPGSGVQSQNYNNTIDELVSHGYVVAAMNSVYIAGSIALPNGHVVQGYKKYQESIRLTEYSDLEYVFQNLQKIDYGKDLSAIISFDKIGMLGHSMGAMNEVYYLHKFPELSNVKAAVFMDPGNVLGDKNYPINVKGYPTLVIWSSYFRAHMNGSAFLNRDDKELILTPDKRQENFSNHINFTDYSTLQYFPGLQQENIKDYLTDPKNVDLGDGNGYLLATRINQKVLDYFDGYLKTSGSY